MLTMIKLRRNSADIELGYHFKISPSSVGRIFTKWLGYMYNQFQKLNVFPDNETIKLHMPSDFKKLFPNTVLIIDGTECPIQQPRNPHDQQATFSNYKNTNTHKSIVGSTPGGLIAYVSNTYSGSATDRQIIERSTLLSKASKGELDGKAIMGDKGFIVQDLFADFNVKIITPAFLKNHNKLTRKESYVSRKISSKRIHIERIIGLCKTYKILSGRLNWPRVSIGEQIFFCCCMLSNFRRPIVNEFA